LFLIDRLNLDNVAVCIVRWYGGIQLGADRFKHISNAAREALTFLSCNSSSSTAQMSNRVEARDRAILALAAMVLQQEQQTQQTFGDMMRPMRRTGRLTLTKWTTSTLTTRC
jgi:putative IMPACT (imprinted ancient) family translation regulator